MENLNKENFWNELYEQLPEAVQTFCNWIDDYKKANHWAKLFNPFYKESDNKGAFICPKFHDLPLAMQLGILQEFAFEFPAGLKDAPYMFRPLNEFEAQIECAKTYFQELQDTF